MILDYFLCTTIYAVLNERIAKRNGQLCEDLLGTFEVVLTMFKANHPSEYVSDDLQVKLQILTFANLLFRRHIRSWWLPSGATLYNQRKKNTERAKRWIQSHKDSGIIPLNGSDDLVVPKSSLAANRRDMLSHLCISYGQDLPDLECSVSLLDILPQYITLCKMVPVSVRDSWMDEALVFMLQSAIEQVLIWETHFQHLLTEFPLLHLEEVILESLSSFLSMLDTPILMQLEAGKLDGLTVTETETFKDRIGIK